MTRESAITIMCALSAAKVDTKKHLRDARASNDKRESIAFWEQCLRAEAYAQIEFEGWYYGETLPRGGF